MTEMFGEAWSPMSVPDLAPDDDDEGNFKQKAKTKRSNLCPYIIFHTFLTEP